ncbi:CoA transferase [Pseudonocardia ailaonensis]|uniref:CoA transferase n=1 Tax=Pseudonocardia ailaonensis TaxID=367279 RepID=A0ABN2NPI1_9PSEU
MSEFASEPSARRELAGEPSAGRGPLAGVTVLQAADGVAAPYCGMLLADLGAEVTVLDPEGDRTRGWRADGLVYSLLNRGKGVAEGATGHDVVLVDTDSLARRPELRSHVEAPTGISCRFSLFGPDGGWGDAPLSELAAQLLSEATSSVGDPGHPGRAGVDIGSTYAGIFAAQAICATLACGTEPEVIDVSTVGALLTMRSTLWVALSNPDEWWGFHLDSYTRPPFRGYRCADGAIYFDLRFAASVDWDALVTELGIADVRDDPRYPALLVQGAGPTGRYADEAREVWERGFAGRTVAEVTALLRRYEGNVFPVLEYPALLASEQVAAVGAVVPATAGVPAHIAPPWEFSATPLEHDPSPAP